MCHEKNNFNYVKILSAFTFLKNMFNISKNIKKEKGYRSRFISHRFEVVIF